MRLLLYIFPIVLFFSSCKEVQDIKVIAVEGFRINKLNTDGIEAEVNLKIKNENAIGFSIYPSEFDIAFSGVRLGKAKLHKRIHINGSSEKVYSFILKSGFGDLNILDLTKLLNTGNLGKIEVTGDLKVGKFFIKHKVPVNFSDKIRLLK